MALEPQDLDRISEIVYRHADALAAAFTKSLERVEVWLAASERRLLGGLGGIGDRLLEIEANLEIDPNGHA